MGKDYGSWSIADLKNELRKRNAKLTGKKAVLVKRLEDYDKLFGPLITDPNSVFKISLPAPQHFKDVTTTTVMPKFTTDDLQTFCQLTEREDINTSKNMYKEYFLISCRVATIDEEYFVTAMVASEMRKNIIYNVAIKLKSQLILEAQCECAAGMGPYAQCKHVLVLIFGIIDYNKSKKILLKTSSTSNLQTFHHPSRVYSGEPIKAEDLKLKPNDQKYKEIATFDPRPAIETPEKYTESFKNLISNYAGQKKETTQTMPILQLLKAADKESVYRDHDYLENAFEECFLESLNLTEEGRRCLEERTRTDKKLWKKERLYRLHSSNFGNICKCKNNGKSLAMSLVKNTDFSNKAIKHGLQYEDEAVRKFENITQLQTEKCGIIVDPHNQYLACTPDRLIGDNYVLEVKCPFTAKNQKISPETVPYLYLCDRTGVLKLNQNHNYYYQVQGQLLCTGRQRAFFCVYTISDIQIINVERNNDFIESMFQKLKQFYENYFKSVMC